MSPNRLVVLNAGSARFECTFGRGCEGTCCREGRPPVTRDDIARIGPVYRIALDLMRPAASRVVKRAGYAHSGRNGGPPELRVADGWCVFFHNGCLLHRLGELSGNQFAYKPIHCALFPLHPRSDKTWYVRQNGYMSEAWNLSCLQPGPQTPLASNTLKREMRLAAQFTRG